MVALDSNYGGVADMGGSQDPDVTPKPLRIVKRGNRNKSESLNTLRTLSNWSALSTPIPTRTSSVSSSCTQRHLPRQKPSPGVSRRTNRDVSLALDEQHRGSPTTAANTVAGFPRSSATLATFKPRGPPHAQGIFRMLDNIGEHKSADLNTTTAAQPTATRAFSTGTIGKIKTHRRSNDQEIDLVSPSPLIAQRQAVTDAVPIRGKLETTKHGHGHALRRQSSFGKGFITRMMSNLGHRSHSASMATRSHNLGDPTSNEKALSAVQSQSETVGQLRRISESSTETDISTNNDLEGALAAFPTPPTSSGSSPRPTPTVPITQATSQRHRNLCIPEHASIMGAELTLTAEYDELTSEGGNSMMVAIDVQGAMNPTATGQDLWSQHTGLDVVVIVDNSLYISPSMLMASCETTRTLASMLNVVTDRLAVLCTSPINDHRTLGSDFTKIWPLSSIKVRKLKTVLDAIVTTQEIPSTESWTNTINVAIETLTNSVMPDLDSALLQDTFGHVILLTNNAKGLDAELLSHRRIQFHLICATGVPLSDFDATNCNGWKLRSICGNEPSIVKTQKNLGMVTLINRLHRLIAHARSGKGAGKLTYLELDIKAGPDCTIKGIMGSNEFLTLHPGESRTVLVRIKIHASRTQANTLGSSTTLPEFGPDTSAVLEELDKMLKVVPRSAKILTARLKYKHSLLPLGTTCSIKADCIVMRRILNLGLALRSESDMAEGIAECSVTVHKRLAYYLAAHAAPRHALSAFCKVFGEEGLRSHCPEYTSVTIKELKYQARILERLEIDASPKKSFSPRMKHTIPSPRSDLEYFSAHSPHGTENQKLDGRLMGSPDTQMLDYNSQRDLPVSRRGTTRSSKSSAKGRAASDRIDEQRSENERLPMALQHRRSESQPTALRNKQSMGAQTLSNFKAPRFCG